MTEMQHGAAGFPDTAIVNDAQDRLGMARYARALGAFIATCDTPMTVAVQGGWGCGKTSLLNLIREELPARNVETLWFNTWQYAQLNLESSLSWSMLGVLLRHVGGNSETVGALTRLRAAAMGTAKVVSGMVVGAALNQIGLSAGGASGGANLPHAVDQGVDAVQEITQLRERLQAAVTARLESSGKNRLVVFVDDLDRLAPTRAVELLEVMKVFLDLPSCVFVLAVDYAIVTSGVRVKYPNTDEDTGRRFFDKLIQLPFVVPVGQFRHDTYIQGLVQGFEAVIPGISEDVSTYDDLISKSVGFNPRGLKRVFNAFALLIKVVEADWARDYKSSEDRRVEAALLFGAQCALGRFEHVYHYLTRHANEIEVEWFTGADPGDPVESQPAWRQELREECGLEDASEWEAVEEFLDALWQAAQDRSGDNAEPDADDEEIAQGRALDRLRSSLSMAQITSTQRLGDTPASTVTSGDELDLERIQRFCDVLRETGRPEFGRREVQELAMSDGLPRPDWFCRSTLFRLQHGRYRPPTVDECKQKGVGYKRRRRADAAELAPSFHGKSQVKTFKREFLRHFGVNTVVYASDSGQLADENATIASLRIDPAATYVGRVRLNGRHTVRRAEELIRKDLGLRLRLVNSSGLEADPSLRVAALRQDRVTSMAEQTDNHE